MKKSLAKNAMYKAILNIFNLFVPLLVNPYIMRVLDLELYGAYNRVNAEFSVFLTLAAFGIYNYGVREISRIREHPEKLSKVFTSLFVIGLASNIVVGIFYFIYFSRVSTGVDYYIYLVMMIQLVANIFYIEFVNEAVENYGFITLKTIIIRICYLVSIFIFVKKPTDIIPYSIVVCMTIFANNFVSYCYLKKRIKFDFKHLEIKKHIVPLIIALVLTNVEILYSQLDKLMIGKYLGDVSVSFYVIPTTLIGMLSTVPLSLINVSIPRLSMMIGEGDKEGYMQTLDMTRNVFFSMMSPICFGVLILAPEIMWIYSGEEYVLAYTVLIVACLVRYFTLSTQSVIMNLVMYINNLEKQMVKLLAIFGIFNLVSNYTLVILGVFSPETSLMTTGLSIILFNIVAIRCCRQNLDMKLSYFSSRQMRYLGVSCLFIPIGLMIKMLPIGLMGHVILSIVSCAGLYFAFLYFTKDETLVIILRKFKLDRFLKVNH